MTLVKTKSKPKVSTNYRRLTGQHHRKSQSYIKTYWPYLPVIAVFGLGYTANTFLSSSKGLMGYTTNASLAGGSNNTPTYLLANLKSAANGSLPLLDICLAFITGVLICWLIFRNARRLKRLLKTGEQFLAKHFTIDVILSLLIVSGLIIVSSLGI